MKGEKERVEGEQKKVEGEQTVKRVKKGGGWKKGWGEKNGVKANCPVTSAGANPMQTTALRISLKFPQGHKVIRWHFPFWKIEEEGSLSLDCPECPGILHVKFPDAFVCPDVEMSDSDDEAELEARLEWSCGAVSFGACRCFSICLFTSHLQQEIISRL